MFLDNEPNYDEDKIWKKRIREWKKCFSVTKEIKSFVRGGISSKYRSEIWKMLVNHQISDIKASKGPNYYSYLCNLVNESPVNISKIKNDKTNYHSLNIFFRAMLSNLISK